MAVVDTNTSTGHGQPVWDHRRPIAGRGRAVIYAVDGVAIAAGLAAASALRSPGPDAPAAVATAVVAYMVWLGQARLYRARFITRRSDEIRRIVNAGARTVVTVAMANFVGDLQVDRLWLAAAGGATVVLLSVGRELLRRRFDAKRATGAMARRVLLIGDNHESERFAAMFDEEPSLGYEVVGAIDPRTFDAPRQLTTHVLAAARQNNAHGVIVAATAIDVQGSNRLIRDLVEAGIHVELSSTLADISFDRLTVRPLGRFPVVYIEPRHRKGWRALAKRAFDLAVAGTALVFLAPVLAVLAVAIKVGSQGPVLFRQERVGQDGELFPVLKFRTMVVDAEALLAKLAHDNKGAGPLFKMKEDPRVTRVGAFLRKTSLDELPQLWNVIRGEMSLVGPRPALQAEMKEWSEDLYGRLRVKPGITGMWQVSGRSSTTFEEYTRLDLYYVDNWSLVVDVSILARTIPAVIASRGAY
ncbi:MAG: sugar transferase [Actinomycetota bacterium]